MQAAGKTHCGRVRRVFFTRGWCRRVFIKRRAEIIWIGVGKGHPHLFQIHKRVQEAALAVGIEPELRRWHPHITIARCRDVSAQALRKFLQSNAEFDAGMIRVDAFHLYSSKLTPGGPIDTREFTVPCSGGL